MQEAETNLKRAAVEFLEAAEATTRAVRDAERADPLDAVDTELFELGEFEPAIDAGTLARLKRELGRQRLLPETLVDLVGLARKVADILA